MDLIWILIGLAFFTGSIGAVRFLGSLRAEE
jgi:hypothetical protein